MPELFLIGTHALSSRSTIVGSIAVSIAFVMELTLVPLLLPAIQKQLDLSIGELAWVFNSYGISVAVGVLLGGWLGDAFRTKRVFAIGVLFFAMGSGIVALAHSYELMIAGRMLQGFGGGIFSPLVPILLTSASPGRPGRVLIVWGSLTGYVAAFAPLIYSSLFSDFGWGLAFITFAIVSICALMIVNRSQIVTNAEAERMSVRRYGQLLERGRLLAMFGYVFCTYGAITYFLFRLPLILAESNFQVVNIGLILSIMWLSFSLVSTLLKNSVDAPRVRGILLAAPILIASGFPLVPYCEDITCLVIAAVLLGSGLACSNAPSTQMILKFAPTGMSAVSASLDITFARLGGVATVAFLAESMFDYAVVTILVMSLVAFFCALYASREFNGASWTTP
ncbi:MAG: MFS transporter [Pseudomonadota bacterium]